MKIIIFFVQRKAQWYKVFSISVRERESYLLALYKKQFYAQNYFIELYIKHVFILLEVCSNHGYTYKVSA